ncbi:MAG TPA: DUF433 domain-containing protein [Chloroflexota bacterium]|nr:DUF433 domain-containing protein [Chloroflexota bacterium]
MSAATVSSGFNGLYVVPEVARFLRAGADTAPEGGGAVSLPRPRRLLAWVRRGMALPELAQVAGRELLLTFEDLISLRFVSLLRDAGYSLKHIRKAEDWLRQQTGDPRPFATRDVWKGKFRRELYVHLGGDLVSASKQGQHVFKFWEDEVELILEHRRLDFDARGLARCWQPYPEVTLEPDVQFGAPCVTGTRIPTSAIAGMVKAGDTISYVARSYGLAEATVERALEWEERLLAA